MRCIDGEIEGGQRPFRKRENGEIVTVDIAVREDVRVVRDGEITAQIQVDLPYAPRAAGLAADDVRGREEERASGLRAEREGRSNRRPLDERDRSLYGGRRRNGALR
jgi:hypothetical protein